MPPTSTPFAPVSPYSAAISSLFLAVLVILAAIFVLVAILITVILLRYARRAGSGEPRQVFGARSLEIAWTVAPTVLLIAVFVLTVRAMQQADPTPRASRPADVEIVGHQWWWEVR